MVQPYTHWLALFISHLARALIMKDSSVVCGFFRPRHQMAPLGAAGGRKGICWGFHPTENRSLCVWSQLNHVLGGSVGTEGVARPWVRMARSGCRQGWGRAVPLEAVGAVWQYLPGSVFVL